MSVPVQNIYYLLCYAWNRLEARELVDVSAVPGNRVENLLAQVLADAMTHLLKRGLDRGYLPVEEDGRRLRGKLLLTETVNRMLLQQGRAACRVDELSHDVPHNRVLKAAMRALMTVPDLDSGLSARLRNHCRRLHDVTDVSLTPATFRSVQLHRNVARYGFLMDICRLVERSFLPDPRSGKRRFHPFTADETRMGQLFEAFIRNFLRREQDVFHVSAPKVAWNGHALSGSDDRWLPEMRTDVVLSRPSTRVVLEAKYYAQPYTGYFGAQRLHSNHLYQLLTYLEHLRATEGPAPSGLLLYAGVGDPMRLDYELGGHRVRIRSLSLDQEWRHIDRDLRELASELADDDTEDAGVFSNPHCPDAAPADTIERA